MLHSKKIVSEGKRNSSAKQKQFLSWASIKCLLGAWITPSDIKTKHKQDKARELVRAHYWIKKSKKTSDISVVSPVVFPFEDELQVNKGDYLVITWQPISR